MICATPRRLLSFLGVAPFRSASSRSYGCDSTTRTTSVDDEEKDKSPRAAAIIDTDEREIDSFSSAKCYSIRKQYFAAEVSSKVFIRSLPNWSRWNENEYTPSYGIYHICIYMACTVLIIAAVTFIKTFCLDRPRNKSRGVTLSFASQRIMKKESRLSVKERSEAELPTLRRATSARGTFLVSFCLVTWFSSVCSHGKRDVGAFALRSSGLNARDSQYTSDKGASDSRCQAPFLPVWRLHSWINEIQSRIIIIRTRYRREKSLYIRPEFNLHLISTRSNNSF